MQVNNNNTSKQTTFLKFPYKVTSDLIICQKLIVKRVKDKKKL